MEKEELVVSGTLHAFVSGDSGRGFKPEAGTPNFGLDCNVNFRSNLNKKKVPNFGLNDRLSLY